MDEGKSIKEVVMYTFAYFTPLETVCAQRYCMASNLF